MAASAELDAGGSEPSGGITEETYWSRLKVCGIVKLRLHNEKRWICRRGHGPEQQYPIIVDDPGWMTPEEREAAAEELRRRYAFFDC